MSPMEISGSKPTRRLRKSRKRSSVTEVEAVDDDLKDDGEEVKPVVRRKKQKISQLTSIVSKFSKRTPVKKKLQKSSSPESLEVKKEPVQTTVDNNDHDQWMDKHAPTDLKSLALHKRKLADVRELFEDMLKPYTETKLLILSGPSGCSKSTAVKLLATELIHNETPLIEWFNPSMNTISQFQEFLSEAKYRIGKNLSVILIEELPNVFHADTQDSFQKTLIDWVENSRVLPPLVICITEYDMTSEGTGNQSYGLDNNYTVESIVGRKILGCPSVRRIKFNPVNATLIKKTLKSIVQDEKKVFQNIPTVEITDKISELGTFGDIRSAISAFQFWSQWRIINKDLTIDMGKETIMSIFHAIGKCVYGTKQDEPENDTIMKVNQDYLNRGNILRLGLLENYTRYNSSKFDLLSAVKITDGYSFADTLATESFSLEIATRTTRDTFRNVPLTSSSGSEVGFNFPREWKVNRSIRQCSIEINKYIDIEMRKKGLMRTFQDSNLLYGFYEPMINKQRKFRNKSKLSYLKSINSPKIPLELYEPHEPYIEERLGGPFKEIQVDSDLVADNNESVGMDKYFTAYNSLKKVDDSDSGSEFDDDPIVDSDDGNHDDTFGDDASFENALMNFSQRKAPLEKTVSSLSQTKNAEFFDDFNDDDFSD